MKLGVISTVAYHPKGLDPHLANLRWALPGADIMVFTRSEYGFRPEGPRAGARFLTHPNEHEPHLDYYGYHLKPLLQTVYKDFDVLALCQQDFPFYKVASELAEQCHREQAIVLPTHANCQYFSIYDQAGEQAYPRLWEGNVFYPAELLREAARHDLALGFGLRQFAAYGPLLEMNRYLLRRYYYKVFGGTHPIYEFLSGGAGKLKADLLSELTLWAFTRDIPWVKGQYSACHLQGPEKAHRLRPDCYADPAVLPEVPDFLRMPIMVNWTALSFLIAGVLRPGALAEALVLHPYGDERYRIVRERVGCLAGTASNWMKPGQVEALEWARSLLNRKAGIR